MAVYTKLLEVDDGDWVDVIPVTACRSITIREDKAVVGYPTTDWLVRMPDDTADAIQFSAGEGLTLPAKSNFIGGDLVFRPGVSLGQIKAVDAATTFQQLELLGP